MTVPIDITDPRVVKAYAHPLRAQILRVLDNRVASPRQLATELDAPLATASYHVRQLAALGLVELVRRTARRGAIEHHYTARFRPTITDDTWARLPDIVKRASIGAALRLGVAEVVAAAEDGGFDRGDIHFSRTLARLDEQSWTAIARELERTLARIDKIIDRAAERLENVPEDSVINAAVIMMHFVRGDDTPVGGPWREEAQLFTPSGKTLADQAADLELS